MNRQYFCSLQACASLATQIHSVPLRRISGLILSVLGAGIMYYCGGCQYAPGQAKPPLSAPPATFHFVDVAEPAGLRFTHSNGGKSPLNILDSTGSGLAWIDYNNDKLPDLFCVGGSNRQSSIVNRQSNRLYHNNGNGSFKDVTVQAGLAAVGHYGMGVAVGDYDGDGYDDLYVTCYGPNLLFRNNGDGTFTDTTKKAGISGGAMRAGAPKWSTSAAWFDGDGDGRLDLYVCNYAAFGPKSAQLCKFSDVMSSCSPHQYPAQPDLFFRNRGDGTFEEWTERAGFLKPRSGRGLGVLPFDADGDGKLDVFVANDGSPNFFFRNLGRGKFEEAGFSAGVAVNETASELANMGVDMGDYDNDGKFDIVVTHYQREPNTLFQESGPFTYSDVTTMVGLGAPTWNYLAWGCGFLDANLDGQLELVFINGHVQDNIAKMEPSVSWAQTAQLFQYRDKRFHDVSAQSGPAFQQKLVGRGCAFADYDNDGDVDIAVSSNGGAIHLWRNDSSRGHYLQVRLQGLPPNRAALGARVSVIVDGRPQVAQLISGRSYLADSERRLTFGLGPATKVERLMVHWPGGKKQILTNLPADQCVTVKQPTL